ncbi:T9SS type A sorting domain-containing protein [Hymenobacter edaphi]|nr:T9SS type A sorting domain-containing protein [Hymenobacter edaphi]
MGNFSSLQSTKGGRLLRRLRGWILPALLGAGAASAAQAQCNFTVSATLAGPLTLCPGSSTTLTAAATTPGFNAGGSGFVGLVRAVLPLPNGKTMVGGTFQEYNGATVPRGLVRLNADGSRDASFNRGPIGFDGSGQVLTFALQADGKVLVGGSFMTYDGQDVPDHLIRLNADGSRDLSFNGTNIGLGNTGGTVEALIVQPDGKILVGGGFNTYNGVAVPSGVIRLNADGSRDTGFNGNNYGASGSVHALALRPDGKVLVGGSVSGYNSPTVSNVTRGLILLNADGSHDATYNTHTGIAPGFYYGEVYKLLLQSDGKLLVGGAFSYYNSEGVPSGLVRLNADGSRDPSYTGANQGFTANFGNGLGIVYTLALQPDGKVLVGGAFHDYNLAEANNATVVPNHLVRLNANGSRDLSFNGTNSGFDNYVYGVAVGPGGSVLAAGYYTSYNGAAAAPDYLVSLTSNGNLNNAAAPVAGATYRWNTGATGASLTVTQPGTYTATATTDSCSVASNAVTVGAATPVMVTVTPAGPLALPVGGSATLTASATLPGFASGFANGTQVTTSLVQPDGKLLVGGFFFAYNGDDAAPNYLLRLNVDGTLDKTFNYVPGSTTTGGNNYVQALALQPDGKILVGGDLSAYNGDAAAPNYVMRLNADGTLDTSFNYNGVGVDGSVFALAVQPDGKVLVGGGFDRYNSNTGAPNRLLRLNADGTLDQTFNYVAGNSTNGIAGGVVRALALQADGRIVVGGAFTSYNTLAGAPNNLLRVLSDGTLDQTFNYVAGSTTTGANNEVFTLLAQPDGKTVVGGFFTGYNGADDAPNYLLRLNANGSLDTGFNYVAGSSTTGPSTTVSSSSVFVLGLGLQPDGKIVVGGLFTGYNGSESAPNRLMRLNANGSLDTSFNYAAGNTTNGADLGVDEVALLADGRIYATGVFTSYNGVATPYVLRVNADGTLNNTAQAVPGTITYAFNPGNTSGNTRVVTSSGSYTATVTTADGCSYTSAPVVVTVATAQDLVVSTAAGIPAGTYNNVTVTGTGAGTLQGDITVNGALLVQAGGQLASGCFAVTGSGSFTVADGATLAICSPQGLSSTAGTGLVQTTGARSLSPNATYLYNGTAAQVTGNALPATVRELALSNAAGLTLTQGVQVRRRVNLISGNLALNAQPLTLLSDTSGTALVANTGGVVTGSTATMQRHIETNPAANGYRHYSSPVGNETLATLATAGYTPNFSGAAAYNSSPTPGLVTPFPTVFAYEQDRIATTVSTFSAFDKGWVAPTSGATPMEVGRGYSVNAPGAALVDFTGTLTTGAVTRSGLGRTGADGGWHLLGNPYPSPLDWSTLTLGAGQNLENMDGAMYVFQSSGPYSGSYRTYLAGAPGGSSPLIPAGSGFFVHTTTAGTPGTVRLTNANRTTTFGAQPAFGRPTTDTRPQVLLTLAGAAGGPTDAALLYAENRATTGLDAAYDAVKLPNPSGLNLATLAATGDALAIDGRPAFTAATVVALRVQVPMAGAYTLRASQLLNLVPGTQVFLHDAQTGLDTELLPQTVCPFVLSGLTSGPRFTLVFRPGSVTATGRAQLAAQVQVYPNPASGSFQVQLPLGTTELGLYNALGQRVRVQAVHGRHATMNVTGLAPGVYTLRVQAGTTAISKRVVLN